MIRLEIAAFCLLTALGVVGCDSEPPGDGPVPVPGPVALVFGGVEEASTTLPVVTITSNDSVGSETEGNTFSFTVSRTGSTANTLMVPLFLPTGTADWNAQAGMGDYWISGFSPGAFITWQVLPGNQIAIGFHIPPGASSATCTFLPKVDTLQETSESAIFTLMSWATHTLGQPSSVTLTILDSTVIGDLDLDGDIDVDDITTVLNAFITGNLVGDVDHDGDVDVDDINLVLTAFSG